MFGSLFGNSQVKAMARVIDEMCTLSHRLRSSGSSLDRFFKTHPLKNHRAPQPTEIDQVHTFWLSDGRQGFDVLVDEGIGNGKCWVLISPDGEFKDAHIQSSQEGRYLVRVDSYPRQRGPLAVKLVDEFAKSFGAANTTVA